MNDFKTMAKSGKDFATIIYDHVSEDVENIVAEVFTDGMKIQTILCDESDTSITIQPLAKGNYTYTITQIAGSTVSKSEGEFPIVGDNENDELFRAMMDKLEEVCKQIKKLSDKVDRLAKKTSSDNTEVENQKKYVEYATKLQILNAKLNACESEITALQNEESCENIDEPSLDQMKRDLERMEYQLQTQAMSSDKEKALIKAIGSLSKQIKETERINEQITGTKTTEKSGRSEKLKELLSEKDRLLQEIKVTSEKLTR